MFVTKKKYNELEKRYYKLKYDVVFRKQISMMKDKIIKELENSFDYDELMSLLHEKYTKQQGLEMIKTFIDNNGV